LVFILAGTTIAMQSRDRFGMLFGFGLVLLIALQAAVNIGVTTALLPDKGLPLPFISYGGSNLVFCLLGTGILINVFRQGLGEHSDAKKLKLHARVTPRI
jgi:cell division protein FtsW